MGIGSPAQPKNEENARGNAVKKRLAGPRPRAAYEAAYYISDEYRQQMETNFVFEIFIDLKPYSVVSLKKGTKHALEHLAKLWENKTLSDVTFKFWNESIKGHTMILASGSSVLVAMFQNDFKENQTRIVLINDTKAKVLENLFRYIYDGECPLLENGDQGNEAENDCCPATSSVIRA